MADDEYRFAPNPNVEIVPKVILYDHNDQPLTRRIGFRAMQISTQLPANTTPTRKKPKRGKK